MASLVLAGTRRAESKLGHWFGLLIGLLGVSTTSGSASGQEQASAVLKVASAAPAADAVDRATSDSAKSRSTFWSKVPEAIAADPILSAKWIMARCHDRYKAIQDYACTFTKRERIKGHLVGPQIMTMKARTRPFSIYFRFEQPHTGREAIYVQGRNDNKLLVHDVGLGKLLAGTLAIDPKGGRAMTDNRHPITEAGLGRMIDQLAEGWEREMKPGQMEVTVKEIVHKGRRCLRITSTHPEKKPNYLYYEVRVLVDEELGLPVHFEAYDWPSRPGVPAQLVEEYGFSNIRLNVGLKDLDFDPDNDSYSFGRF